MDKKTQKILLIGAVGVVAYFWWKNRQETSETSEFSNISGYKLRQRLERKCDRPRNQDKSYCKGLEGLASPEGGGTGTGRQTISRLL